MEDKKCEDCKHSTKETVQTVGGGEFSVICCTLAHWLQGGEGTCEKWEAKSGTDVW